MTFSNAIGLLLMASLLILTGCGHSPSANLFTLELSQPPVVPPTFERSDLVIGLRQVDLPPLLNRPQIVLIDGEKVRALELHRWSEPLDEAMLRILAIELRKRLNSSAILSYPWPSTFKPQQMVTIKVDRFNGLPGKHVELAGVLLITQNGDSPTMRTERFHLAAEVDGTGYPELVRAHSAALGQLAEQLVIELKK